MTWRRTSLLVLLALVATAACTTETSETTSSTTVSPTTTVPPDTTTTDPRDALELAKRAVVQVVWAMEDQDGIRFRLNAFGDPFGGSGSIVTPDGLILTNAHVAKPDAPGLAVLYREAPVEPPGLLVVRMVEEEARPPVARFIAEPVTVEGWMDLAVIRVTHHVEMGADGTLVRGAEVDPATLQLPTVPLGDSDAIRVLDPLFVLGFPAIGDETVSGTGNVISGFIDDEKLGARGWIKTDTKIAGGNSGGMGLVDGRLIGVPTRGPELEEEGFNDLRPINFALPLIEDARRGESYVRATGVVLGTGQETVELVRWSTDLDKETGCGIDMVSGFPPGTKVIAAQFTYQGMTDGEDILELWRVPDEVDPQDGRQILVYLWDWGSQGECFPAWFRLRDGQPLPSGAYEVILLAGPNLRLAGRSAVEVGVQSDNLVRIVAEAVDGDTGQPITGATLRFLKAGVNLDEWRANPVGEHVLAEGVTAADGRVDLGALFERGTRYPAVGFAEGYHSVNGSYEVPTDASDSLVVRFSFVRAPGG